MPKKKDVAPDKTTKVRLQLDPRKMTRAEMFKLMQAVREESLAAYKKQQSAVNLDEEKKK